MKECDEVRRAIEETVLENKKLSSDVMTHIVACSDCMSYYQWLLRAHKESADILNKKPDSHQWKAVREKLLREGVIEVGRRWYITRVLVGLASVVSICMLGLFTLSTLLSGLILNLSTVFDYMKVMLIGLDVLSKLSSVMSIIGRVLMVLISGEVSQFLVLFASALSIYLFAVIVWYMRLRFVRASTIVGF
ncbi:MAG: hypothetical protein DRH51_02125 [Candidatus Coatesbacteria bacterium]|nr:MAG: hypothetical protein DRH51_02125 [Candidatus Coatesbacteria bacterium]HEC80666.1 hypothetical protein [Bacillota bacterium]